MVSENVSVDKLMGRGNQNTAGFFTIGPNGPMAVSQRLTGEYGADNEADIVLFHEYVHHFMFQYFPAAYPEWFVEGFAEFYSTTNFDKEGRATFGRPAQHRAYTLIEGQVLPAEKMLVARVNDLNGEGRASLYARGWLLTHYLMFAPERAGQLTRYIKVINDGTDGMVAARAQFGDLAKLDKDLNKYRDAKRISILTQRTATPLPANIAVTSLDPADTAIIMDRLSLMQGANEEQRKKAIANLSAARAKFPASSGTAGLLAQALYEEEDDKAAKTAVDVALALDPKNNHAMLYRGMIDMRQLLKDDVVDPARWKAARSYIVKANRANPDDPYPLYRYYKSFTDQGIDVPPVAGDGLAMASSVIPQDFEMRSAYITYLIGQNKLADALTLIKPLANNPHGGGSADYARDMIKRLEKAISNGGRFEEDDGEDSKPVAAPVKPAEPPKNK
jgi:tetratricopeptide (TPR) repeat protein